MSDELVDDTIFVGSKSTNPAPVVFAPKQTPRPDAGLVTIQDGLSCTLELDRNGPSVGGCIGFDSGAGVLKMHRV